MKVCLILLQSWVILFYQFFISCIQIGISQCHMIANFPDKGVSWPSRCTSQRHGTVLFLSIPDVMKPFAVKISQIKMEHSKFRSHTCICHPSLTLISLTAIGWNRMHVTAHCPYHCLKNIVKSFIRAGKLRNFLIVCMYNFSNNLLFF